MEREIKNYLAVAFGYREHGLYSVHEINIYVNNGSGIYPIDTVHPLGKNMTDTDIIKEVYEKVPESIGNSITTDYIQAD